MNIITVIYRSLVSLQNTNICKNCYSSSYCRPQQSNRLSKHAALLHAGLGSGGGDTVVTTKAP